MFKKLFAMVSFFLVTACGASANDSTVITPSDSLSTTVSVLFDGSASRVTVIKPGQDLQSSVFEDCMLNMQPVKDTLEYELVDQNTLQLGSGTFDYKRPLATPRTKAGVDSRVFSVWGLPDVFTSGVTISVELEVEPEQLTFRLNCSA